MASSSSPFTSFSAKGFEQQGNKDSSVSPVAPTARNATPADAMKTDVYRSYSLMDVAFWDFGKPNGGSLMSRWFGAAKPTSSPSGTGEGGIQRDLKAPAATAGAGPSNGTWAQWIWGTK